MIARVKLSEHALLVLTLASKTRVCDKAHPKMKGTVVEAGEQQSLVKWDHSGQTQCVSNKWLREIKS